MFFYHDVSIFSCIPGVAIVYKIVLYSGLHGLKIEYTKNLKLIIEENNLTQPA